MDVSTAIEKMLRLHPYGSKAVPCTYVAHDPAGRVAATNGVTAVICRAEVSLEDRGGLAFDSIELAMFADRVSIARRIDPRQLRAALRVFDAVGELPTIKYCCGAYLLESVTLTVLIMAVR